MTKIYTAVEVGDMYANPLRHKLQWPPEGDKRFALSWTKLDMFDSCPFKYEAIHIKKSVIVEYSGEAAEWGEKVHKVAEDYLRLDKPIPEEMEKYAPVWESAKKRAWDLFEVSKVAPSCEDKWAIDIRGNSVSYFDKNVFIRGQSDYTFAAPNTILTLDWKTGAGKYPKTGQLEVLSLLAKAQKSYKRFGKFKGVLVFLDAEKMVNHSTDLSTPEKHGEVLKHWQAEAIKIVECYEDDHFPKKQSPLCGWCPVGHCQYNTNKDVEV